MTDDLYDGPAVAPEEVISVYVVVNGALGMSPGKVASQSFHCGYLIGKSTLTHEFVTSNWRWQGRRVVVRVAQTQHVFDRVMAETQGQAQTDEGITEVKRGSVTAWVTKPYRRADAPKILSHKRCQLL